MNTKIKVLIAEDDPFIGMITKECFETRGFEVCLCEDGNVALKQYHEFQPNICIFDVMMPFKDGFTLAEEIRVLDQKISILFLTAKSLKEDEEIYRVRRLAENIRRISEYASDIAEIVLNMNIEKTLKKMD